MELQKIGFSVGQLVYGKVKGYAPWPAVITKIDRNIATIVYFAANQKFSNLALKNLTPYHAGRKIVAKYYGHNMKFSRAFDEADVVWQAKLKQEEELKQKELIEMKKKKKMDELPKKPTIVLERLSQMDIQKIQKKLKQENSKRKKLRSGRIF